MCESIRSPKSLEPNIIIMVLKGMPLRVLVDLSSAKRVTEREVHLMWLLKKNIEMNGGKLILCMTKDCGSWHKIVEILKMGEFFTIFPTMEDAINGE